MAILARKGRPDRLAPQEPPDQQDLPDHRDLKDLPATRAYLVRKVCPAPLAQPALRDRRGLKGLQAPRERPDRLDQQDLPGQLGPRDQPDLQDQPVRKALREISIAPRPVEI
ncbi:hypothetical protein GCM10009415_21250 [Chitinophaga japonensis]